MYCVSERVVEDCVRQAASCTRQHGSNMDLTLFRLISLFPSLISEDAHPGSFQMKTIGYWVTYILICIFPVTMKEAAL